MTGDEFDEIPADYDPAADFGDPFAAPGGTDQLSAQVEAHQRAAGLAARYAFLSSLGAGVKTNQELVAAELQQVYREAGLSRGSEQTPFGPVAMAAKGGGQEIEITDEAAFLSWSEADDPGSIERRIKDAHRKAILTHRFEIRDGQVVDTGTGEVVPFARAKDVPVGDPTPTHSASNAQREAKMAAATFIAERLAGATPTLDQLLPPGTPDRAALPASAE